MWKKSQGLWTVWKCGLLLLLRLRAGLARLLGHFTPVAVDVELEHDRVVDQAIDGSGCRHLVLEDAVPPAEHQVARDHHRPALIALGEQREQYLGVLRALADVAEVVEDQQLVVVELSKQSREV